MKTKVGFDSVLKLLMLLGWFVLFIGGVTHYTGSSVTYTMFSVVFLMMLASGFASINYGYLFLVVMLWLGFWFKLTIHTFIDFPFEEPVGIFVGSPNAWDEVLRVATIGSIGVIIARVLYGFVGQPSSLVVQKDIFKVPIWFSANRRWIWALTALFSVGLAIVNALLGIQRIGLVPETILLWPLNAIISWLLDFGIALGIATLLWWDVVSGRKISLVVYFVLLEAVASTLSVLSRGIYIFHVIPQVVGLYKIKGLISPLSRVNVAVFAFVFVMLLAMSYSLVNTSRNYFYSAAANTTAGAAANTTAGVFDNINTLGSFAVQRWIGLEGLMAVTAYPSKGSELLDQAMSEKSGIGKVTIYQEICQSHYRFTDTSKYQFASLPGPVAFFYFSGNWCVVVLGMMILVFGVMGSERLVYKMTGNPLACALWGSSIAHAVAQIGIAPRGLVIYFFEMSCGVATICFFQSKFFATCLQKLNAFISLKSKI